MANDELDRAMMRRAMADLRAHVEGRKSMRSFRVSTVPIVEVRAIREALGDSAEQFAARLGVPVDVVITWECREGSLEPDVCRLLALLAIYPEQVTRELASLRSGLQ